ncbi:MAG: Ser/Thr and Tyr protein phosphatase [Gammaproteobacteria bacterium]|nr:Ser/Thr and Tyr protein phosphatase [Gammaproteobacteria bacterium]
MQKHKLPKLNRVWKTYFYWLFWISIAFFTVNPTCNWVSNQRADTLGLYSSAELNIPFIPQFVWAYLSLYLLFLIPPFFLSHQRMNILGRQLITVTIFCGLVFLLLPTQLGFERAVPEAPFYSALFANLFAIDLPHNMVPSLHVAFSTLILFTLLKDSRSALARSLFGAWLVIICASTIFVHQHHLLDVATGLLVATFFYRVARKGEHHV